MDQAEKIKGDLAVEDKKAAGARESIARQMADLEGKGKALEAQLKQLTAEMIGDVSPRWAAESKPAVEREELVDIRGLAQALWPGRDAIGKRKIVRSKGRQRSPAA